MRAERFGESTLLLFAPSGERFSRYEDVAARVTESVREGDEVTVTGAMPMALAASVAFLAAARGARTIHCITPPDGMSRVEVLGPNLGSASAIPDWLEQKFISVRESRTFGIIGFPNSGKSVLSKLLELAMRGKDRLCWVFEADPASPTPPWFFELQRSQKAVADELRLAYKVDWTDEMQRQVAERLGRSRRFFDRVVVDLPGGDMENNQPIPPGREALFAQVDRLIIVRRPDRADNVQIWIDALAKHGFEGRIHAVIDSIDVDADASLELEEPTGSQRWLRGRARGLRREADHGHVGTDASVSGPFRRLLEAHQ